MTRGDRMSGLLSYLAGPGRSNEHTEPHLVAGDPALLAWHDDAELGREAALSIARHLDKPRVALGVEVTGGHVWHCSLSLRAEEGQLTDQRWADIAHDFVKAMEFDDNESTKAPCRWVAIRHGVSTNGNDHIHIAVNLVREDGTKASIHNDFHRAQVAARALERKYGLEELESSKAERSTRGYDPAEREAQARGRARAKYERARADQPSTTPAWELLDGNDRQARIASEMRDDQPRYVLSLKVRGCATASGDEAEFVRRMRRAGLLVRPRFADGRTDVITGYSVAERPEAGERPIWYGGGHLGRDLTLPRLRDGWPDTPTGATDAAAEWNAAKRGRRVVAPGPETQEPDPELWSRLNDELGDLVDRMHSVPVEDRDTWATVARQTAGALAAWSNATEEMPGDLAAASEALSRSAQTYGRTVRPHKAGTVAISGAAMLLASAMRGGQGTVAQAVMIRELLRLAQAVTDAAEAAQQARHAKLLAGDVRARLTRLRDALPDPKTATRVSVEPAVATSVAVDRMKAGHADEATRIGSPIPNRIEPGQARPAAPAGKPDREGPDR